MDELWREISTAKWVAEVGIPLTVAVLAVFGAFAALGRQLRHDRETLQAQRRSEIARTFANDVSQAIDGIWYMPRQHLGWRREWTGSRILRSRDTFSAQLPEAIQYRAIYQGTQDLWLAWGACLGRLGELEKSGRRYSNETVADAQIHAHIHLLSEFRRAGRVLQEWDGFLPAPKLDWNRNHYPWSLPYARRDEWSSFYAKRFEEKLREH